MLRVVDLKANSDGARILIDVWIDEGELSPEHFVGKGSCGCRYFELICLIHFVRTIGTVADWQKRHIVFVDLRLNPDRCDIGNFI